MGSPVFAIVSNFEVLVVRLFVGPSVCVPHRRYSSRAANQIVTQWNVDTGYTAILFGFWCVDWWKIMFRCPYVPRRGGSGTDVSFGYGISKLSFDYFRGVVVGVAGGETFVIGVVRVLHSC